MKFVQLIEFLNYYYNHLYKEKEKLQFQILILIY